MQKIDLSICFSEKQILNITKEIIPQVIEIKDKIISELDSGTIESLSMRYPSQIPTFEKDTHRKMLGITIPWNKKTTIVNAPIGVEELIKKILALKLNQINQTILPFKYSYTMDSVQVRKNLTEKKQFSSILLQTKNIDSVDDFKSIVSEIINSLDKKIAADKRYLRYKNILPEVVQTIIISNNTISFELFEDLEINEYLTKIELIDKVGLLYPENNIINISPSLNSKQNKIVGMTFIMSKSVEEI